MKLVFEPFRPEDFPEYKNWYKDGDLNQRLGPMDDDWLKHILKEADGMEYAVRSNGDMIAVVGFKMPTKEHPAHYLTDLAVNPAMRGSGIGSAVVQELIRLHPGTWKTFVDEKNEDAKRFFERNGWKCISQKPDTDGMWEMASAPLRQDFGGQAGSA